MNYLRQATGVSITLGPFRSFGAPGGSTDTLLGGVVLGGTSVGLIKSNSATSVSLGGRDFSLAETGCSGYYRMELTTTDSNTTGALKVFVSGSTGGSNSFADVVENFEVVSQTYYDFMHGDAVLSTGVSVHAFAGTSLSDSGVTVESLTTTAEADVNAEIVDALNVDTYGEPAQGAMSATTTPIGKLGYIYKFIRNKVTNDGTYMKVFADDTTTCDHKASVSESGGTVTRGEFITGA